MVSPPQEQLGDLSRFFPPILGKLLIPIPGYEISGLAVKGFLGLSTFGQMPFRSMIGVDQNCELATGAPAPEFRMVAARELERLANLDRRSLRSLPTAEFLRGWYALLFLFPSLHPDNAVDHGQDIGEMPTEHLGLPTFERELGRRHIRSGWPVALEGIGHEALRRRGLKEVSERQFYCLASRRVGLGAEAFPPRSDSSV